MLVISVIIITSLMKNGAGIFAISLMMKDCAIFVRSLMKSRTS